MLDKIASQIDQYNRKHHSELDARVKVLAAQLEVMRMLGETTGNAELLDVYARLSAKVSGLQHELELINGQLEMS